MRFLLAILLLLLPLISYSQNELDEKKGFQDLVLGSDPKSYPGLELKKTLKSDEVPEFEIFEPKKNFYTEVGGIKIYKLQVKSFQDKIYEIEITAEKNPDFYNGLEAKYGKANYSLPTNSYVWGGKELRLSFQSHSKKKVKLTYYYHAIKDWVKAWEKKNVKSIADDF